MRITATADLHGKLDVKVPECDLLVIAGDIFPAGLGSLRGRDIWLFDVFYDWLESTPAERVVWIAGNRDRHIEAQVKSLSVGEKITYLQDSWIEIDGLKVYGTPWTRIIGQWAFSLGERPQEPDDDGFPTIGSDDLGRTHRLTAYAARKGISLHHVFARIPNNTDILITHGPPYGTCDRNIEGEHIGSTTLRDRVKEIQPQLLICGHAHHAYGTGHLGATKVANVSRADELYRPVNPPMTFDIDPKGQRPSRAKNLR